MNAPSPESQTPVRVVPLTIFAVIATMIQTLDTTIANIALPHIQGSLSASQDQVTWVVTSYVVAAAISTPLLGFLVERVGRKRLYVASIIGFTVTSVLCGASQTIGQIVFMRALQGAVGAFLVPLSQSVILDIYPPERRTVGIAAWGVGSILGPIIGPVLGGYLTEFLSWRWVFYVNVPVGIIAAAGIIALLPESKRPERIRFDLLGFVLIGIALASLQLALDRGTILDWFASREIIWEFSIAALTFYLFVVHTLTTAHPLFNPAIFKDVNFVVGNMLAFLTNLAIFSMLTLVPLMMQTLMGYPIITTGVAMIPRAVSSAVSMLVAGRLSLIMETRTVAALGMVGLTATLWQMSTFNLDVSDNLLMVNGAIQGFMMGLVSVPLVGLAFSTLPSQHRTDGTAMLSLVRNLSGSIGVSACTTMITRLTQVNHARIIEQVSPFSPAFQAVTGETIMRGQIVPMAVGLEAEISRQAAMIAYIDLFRFGSYGVMVTLLLIPLLRRTSARGLADAPVVEA